jgi:glutamate racemase
MIHTVALIHTVGELLPIFKDLCHEILPDATCFHVLDEGLLRTITPSGQLPPRAARRLAELVSRAEDDGADLILVTCSSVSPLVDLVRCQVERPVLKIDEAMADQAVQDADRIGILATTRTALEPVTELILSRAAAQQKQVRTRSHLLDGALAALQAGNSVSHDRQVINGIQELARWADLVVLAQISMARALRSWPESQRPCPVLTSARLGLMRAADMLKDLESRRCTE